MPTIQDVIRTRNSARNRRRSLRRLNTREAASEVSPLMACGSAFAENVNRIEREYDEMLQRIDNATVLL